MVPYLRLYDLSLINYLKYQVLPAHFAEMITGEAVVQHPSIAGSYIASSSVLPSPTSRGRGWVPFDELVVAGKAVMDLSSEQVSQVTVYGASSYTIDYPNGRIVGPDTVPTSVDYMWNYVSFVEGWPSSDPPPLPVVALDLETNVKSGYQIGGGTRDTLTGAVHIFASDESEKKDITDVIYQALYNKTLPIENWHEGNHLDFDGTYAGFTPMSVSGLGYGIFLDVEASFVGRRFDWSEVNRHRSTVTFTFEVLKSE